MRKTVLFEQRQVWMPTLYGWSLLLFIGFASAMLLRGSLYAFLAPNDPAGANVLVVEGWLAPEELDQAIVAFTKGKYERIVTTGGPVAGWPGLSKDTVYAELAAVYLEKRGIRSEQLIVVPAPKSAQERTFLSAVMFREAAKRQGMTLGAVDIFSAGPHARRSRLLFQMALGDGVRVGVLAARPESFNADAWWQSSAGVEQMFFQSFGYVWVKCCFWPGPPGSLKELWSVP